MRESLRWALGVVLVVAGGALIATNPPQPLLGALDTTTVGRYLLLGGCVIFLLLLEKRGSLWQRLRASRRGARPTSAPLPLPSVPPDAARAPDAHLEELARLPWGRQPSVRDTDAQGTFDQLVARVRRVHGEWSQLSELGRACADLPTPYCFIGAAEIVLRASTSGWRRAAPTGLLVGLRYVAQAEEQAPRHADALIIRVKLLAAAELPEWTALAKQTFALLAQTAPTHLRLPDAEAALHLHAGDYDSAVACLRRLVANPPSLEETYQARTDIAQLLAKLGRDAEALATYDQTLAIDPNDPWTFYHKAFILLGLGRRDEAEVCNERALSIMDFPEARALQAKMRVGAAPLVDDPV